MICYVTEGKNTLKKKTQNNKEFERKKGTRKGHKNI